MTRNIFLVLAALVGCTHEGSSAPPYPPSPVISHVQWDTGSIVTAAPGSDLWPTTWAADGNVYTSWGDGGGFGGTNNTGRVSMGFARLEGIPPNIAPANVNGGVEPESPATWACRACGKTAGILAVGDTIYSWVNEQDGTPPRLRLYWSDDLAATWEGADWAFPDSADPEFFPSAFVNFGRAYEDATDEFVYSYGGRWVYAQGPENSVYLARVPRERIRDRTAYEFYSGTDATGNPIWDTDITARSPVFTDANGVNNTGLVNVVYVAPLGRFILTVAHRAPRSTEAGIGRLGIFDAPDPWGPWTTVDYYDDWLGLGNGFALNYDIPTKWIGASGLDFWMTFSSGDELDRFNLVPGRFVLVSGESGK